MRPNRNLTLAFLALLVLPVSSSCRSRPEPEVGTPASPLVLVLPQSHAKGKETHVEALRAFLEKSSGLSVKVHVARSAVEAIQSFGSRHADVGLLPLFEYLLAHQEYEVEARLQVVRDGAKPRYQGQILVRADSPIASLADLSNKKLAYADPYSMTGFVLPAEMLAQANVRPVPVFAGGHAEALAELKAGRVDAAATFVGAVPDGLEAAGLRTLAETGSVPNEPVFMRKRLDEQKRQAIADALLKFSQTEEGKAALAAIAGIRGFSATTDDAYREVPALVKTAGQRIEGLVPGGWIVWQSNRSDVAP